MRALRIVPLGLVLLCCLSGLSAQVELPPAAREVLKQFEDETAEVEKKTEADLDKWKERRLADLKKVQDVFCKDLKLDEAVAVRDLIRGLRAGADVASFGELPPAAREVCKQYEDELAGIYKQADAEILKRRAKAAAELQKIQDAFCREAKLDEAVAVRDVIRTVREGVTNALPDPGYINNGTTDIGKVFYFQTTGVSTGQSIYGTDIYTNGSHLGMAAVHCGLLKDGQKGVVKVTILPGQVSYAATTRHGVTSIAYGSWSVSFKVERVYGLRAAMLTTPRIRPERLKDEVRKDEKKD
jgi:hypothetical protein